MIDAGTISAHDLDLMLVTDSVDEAMTHIEQQAVVKFGLTRRRRPTPVDPARREAAAGLRPHHRTRARHRAPDLRRSSTCGRTRLADALCTGHA